MRDLQNIANECLAEVDRLKIPRAKAITFAANCRAKTRLGVCKKTGDRYVIEIATSLLDERAPLKEGLKNTLVHEILHTCRGCMKHTGRWKQYADRMNAAYGYAIQRTASREEGLVPEPLAPKPRYRIVCQSCGAVYERYKMSAFVKHPERYRCGQCKKPFPAVNNH